MRRSRRQQILSTGRAVLAWAMLAVIAGLPTAASSQTNAAQPAMPELEEARSVLSRIQQYKSACDALHSVRN